MAITKELLQQMLEAYGGVPLDDAELEAAVKNVETYLAQAAAVDELDLSAVYSGRVIHLEPPESAT